MRQTHWRAWFLLFALLTCLIAPRTVARAADPRWTHFSTLDGLPSDTIWAMAAGPGQGDLWLGTSRGASLFRAGRWYSYTHEQGLGDDWVAALAVDAHARVWFGTYGGGLTLLDGDRWQTFTSANSGLGNNWVTALAVDPQDRLWVGTWGKGVSLYDNGQWQTFASGSSALPADFVTALAVSPDGTLWVGLHGQGVARLVAGNWTLFTTGNGLADNFVNALAVGSAGDVWVGTAQGLTHLDASGQLLRTYTEKDGLPDDRVQALTLDPQGGLWVGTADGAGLFSQDKWTVYRGPTTLSHNYVSAIAAPAANAVWFGSLSAGATSLGTVSVASLRRPPVILVHGWHGPDSDKLEDSEFRFLADWLHQDGYPVYYAEGILPTNTLHKNAAHLRDVIARAKKETGAAQVDIIAFSMGGLNTRTYLESALYEGDVAQAFILGTPEVGVREWHPFLLREIQEWERDPSAIELTPEYAALFNDLHRKSDAVSYTLIAGAADSPDLPQTLRSLPAGDALIMAGEALALDGTNVHKVLTDDLHAFSGETILLGLPSYLYPRRTYDAYIRPALSLGPGASLPNAAAGQTPSVPVADSPLHSPFFSGEVAAGQSVTQTVAVDTAGETAFYLRSEGGALTFSLIDPSGNKVDAKTIGERGEFFDLNMANVQAYWLRNAESGAWQVVVGRTGDSTGKVRFNGYATLTSPTSLGLNVGPQGLQVNATAAITAALQTSAGIAPQANKMEAEIGRPDRRVERLPLFDDGQHGDGAAGDGVYGLTYRPAAGGYYTVFVTATGEANGVALARTNETLLAVSPGTAALTGAYSEAGQDTDRDGKFESLGLTVGVEARSAGSYLLAATLADSAGRELTRIVAPVSLNAGPQNVTLRFPGAAVLQGHTDGPYQVVRVRLLDENGAALPLQEATNVLTTRAYRYQDFE